MSSGNKDRDGVEGNLDRRDVLKTAAGVGAAGTLGVLSTGTAAAQPSMDAAFLTDNCRLNLYQHHDQAEYASAVDKTFHIYQSTDNGGSNTNDEDSDGDAYAVAYDHDTGDVEGPVRIGYNDLTAGDTHGVPSMTIDGDGYIHTFFGDHGNTGGFEYARSENPYDISSWIFPPDGSSGSDTLTDLPRGTYSCMAYNPDEDAVYVLYRSGNGSGAYPSHDHATLGKSTDNGQNWTDVNNGVIDQTDSPWNHTDVYVADLAAWAGRIHMTWTVAESHSHGQPRKHIYHAAYNPDTGNMENMSGKDLGGTVSWNQVVNDCKVKDTGDTLIEGDSTRTFNHAYDPNSDTAYIPARYPVDSNTSQLRLMSYRGVSDGSGSWQESGQITTTSDPGRPSAEVRVADNGDVEITDQRGFNGLWRRENGTWNHYDYPAGTGGIDKIQRAVVNGSDDFGWVGRTIESQNGSSFRVVYALGSDGSQPAGAGADFTRPPQNLRVITDDGSTATIDWDEGLAGPSGVEKYRVYVDGNLEKEVTQTPAGNTPYPRTWTDVNYGGGQPDVEVTLVNNDSTESATSNAVTVGDPDEQTPYGGSAWSIPGRIEAEDFDEGGQNVAYWDSDAGNNGSADYRSGEDVDIATTDDHGGDEYNVGYIEPDEWLEFTVDVGSSDSYDLDLRVASPNDQTQRCHVEVDGTDVTGLVDVPDTGDWNEWTTVTVEDISLSAGEHVVRWYFDEKGYNVNYMEWSEADGGGGGQSPYGGTPRSIPGKIEAEDFDEGGEGVAYHDTTAGNEGGSTYRDGEDVDLGTGGSGVNLGWTADDEWLEYTVDVESSGTYDLDLRVCSNSTGGADIHFEFDGTDETGIIDVPNNGSWSNYQTITVNDVDLNAGEQVMRLYIDSAAFNLDWMDWSLQSGGLPTEVSRWTLDGTTASDSVGSNDGTITGNPTTGVTGKDGDAWDFDGTDDYIVVSDDASLNPTDITVSAWVKTSNLSSNDQSYFVRKWDYGSATGYHLIDHGEYGDDVRFSVAGSGSRHHATTPRSNVNDGNWHHLVGVKSGSTLKLYLDGTEVDSQTGVSMDANTADDLGIAAAAGSGANLVDGTMDDVRIWDVGLSSSEVQDLYDSY